MTYSVLTQDDLAKWWITGTGSSVNRLSEVMDDQADGPAIFHLDAANAWTAGTGSEWYVATATSILGACLTGQGRYEEAEPLLKEGFRRLATEMPATDLTEIFKEDSETRWVDGGHPNAEGSKKIADSILALLGKQEIKARRSLAREP